MVCRFGDMFRICMFYMKFSSGVPDEKALDDFGIQRWMESSKIYASALIVSAYTEQYSHWNAVESLSSWLKKHNVPGLFGSFFPIYDFPSELIFISQESILVR